MAAPAVEAFEGWAPAAPEAVGEAVDGEPLAEDVVAEGDPVPELVGEEAPDVLIGLEADEGLDGVLGLLTLGAEEVLGVEVVGVLAA